MIQFAKNAPLNALIILARDERFLFQAYFSKGGPLDDFSKRFLGYPLWLFFCCQSLFSANTAIHPHPQSVGYHIVIISKAKAQAPSPQPVRQNIASAKHNSANLVLSLAQLSPSLFKFIVKLQSKSKNSD